MGKNHTEIPIGGLSDAYWAVTKTNPPKVKLYINRKPIYSIFVDGDAVFRFEDGDAKIVLMTLREARHLHAMLGNALLTANAWRVKQLKQKAKAKKTGWKTK